MSSRIVFGVCGLAAVQAAEWAVIMAGSNTYGNYRHQADAFHAYQVVKSHGIPQDHIILLAYDDIANDKRNPFPGKVFNKPSADAGVDVYDGVHISYSGKDVTAANFLKVLRGDDSANGPVLKSTSEDDVFVYFADHGGPGILGVPDGNGDFIHAHAVNAALSDLQKNGGFKKLVFYLEACESGSIFNKLLTTPNVYATTAASPTQSSYGVYCPSEDKVNGKHIGSCLGDEYSIRWLEDSDAADWSTETIGEQMEKVKKETKKSQVHFYGDKSIGKSKISEFEGPNAAAVNAATGPILNVTRINNRDAALFSSEWRMIHGETVEARMLGKQDYDEEKARRAHAALKFEGIAVAAVGKARSQHVLEGEISAIVDVECHMKSLEAVVGSCGSLDDYSLRYSRLFANLCDSEGLELPAIQNAVTGVCARPDIIV